MYNTRSKNRYLLKSGTDHKLLLEESGLAELIKKWLPLNGSDDDSNQFQFEKWQLNKKFLT